MEKEKISLTDELAKVRSDRDSLQDKLLEECNKDNSSFERKLTDEIGTFFLVKIKQLIYFYGILFALFWDNFYEKKTYFE